MMYSCFIITEDGNIGFEEYILLMKDTYLQIDLNCERYKASFMLIDTNKDGVISFEELVRALAFKKEQYDLNQVRELFSSADTDNDGIINFKGNLFSHIRIDRNQGNSKQSVYMYIVIYNTY